jgi:hypothetical protein
MEEANKQDFTKLTNLNSIKEFCETRIAEIALGELKMENHNCKVRYIDQNGKFGVTGFGCFFFFENSMYILTNDQKYEKFHNSDIYNFRDDFEILRVSTDYIVRVIFAGVFTGFIDDKGERIFTGDVVKAKILKNPTTPSTGGTKRARNLENESIASNYETCVNDIFGNYSLIFDNISLPLSWATELKVVGSLFYELKKQEKEVDIQCLCNSFAQSRIDRKELNKLIKKSPYLPPVTWQEKAAEIICGENNI